MSTDEYLSNEQCVARAQACDHAAGPDSQGDCRGCQRSLVVDWVKALTP